MIKLRYLLPISLFALFTAPFLLAAPSNAYRWDINTFPVSTQTILNYGSNTRLGTLNPAIEVRYPSSVSASDFENLNKFKYFQSHYNELSGKCEYSPNWGFNNQSYHDYYSSYPKFNNSTWFLGFTSYYGVYNGFHTTTEGAYLKAKCQQDAPFGSSHPFSPVQGMISGFTPMPQFDDSSLVNIPPIDRWSYEGLPPNWFDFDEIHLSDKKTIQGVDYFNNLSMSELLGGKYVPGFWQFTLPLGYAPLDFSAEGQVEVRGTFDFDADPGFHANIFRIETFYGKKVQSNADYAQPLGYTLSFETYKKQDCDVSYDSANFDINFSCKYQTSDLTSTNMAQGTYNISLYIDNGDSSVPIFSNDVDFRFKDFTVITDGNTDCRDEAHCFWGSNFNQGTASGISYAPGSAYEDPDDADWFSSLVGMFRFNALNPFQPIFNMFNNPDGCVNIPIIAGMLNSTETSYCTWFPSNVRLVLTPVLSMASVMLVFGFFVRWLGSSSGNFFEDSKGETVSWSGRKSKK